MRVRPWATFTTDLPDDQIEEGPQIVQFAGKSVANALGEVFTQLGCDVSEPIYAHEHGWELHILAGRQRRRLWCQVTLIDTYVMVFEQNSWIADLLGRYHPVYLEVLTRLAATLANDARFDNVRWYTSEEVHTASPGASQPVGS